MVFRVKVDAAAVQSDFPPVTLAKFENGILLSPDSLKSVQAFSSQVHDTKNSFKRKYLVAETDRMQYVGDNFGRTAAKYQNLCQYYVGIVNKKAKVMKLMKCELFNLRPSVTGPDKENDVSNESNFQEQRTELTLAFGSLKKQRAVESRFRHKVDTDDLDKVVNKVLDDVTVDESVLETKDVSLETASDDVIPPINRNAVKVEDVYKLNDIISEKDLLFLDDHSRTLSDADKEMIKQWKMESKYCNFILEYLPQLPRSTEKRLEKCKLLVYLQFLVMLLNLKYTDFRRKDPFPDVIPDPIKKKLLSEFVQTNAGISGAKSVTSMSQKQKDKVAAHVMVLALIISNYNLRVNALMADMKHSVKKCQLLANVVGAKFEKRGTDYFLSLTIPLATVHQKAAPKRRK